MTDNTATVAMLQGALAAYIERNADEANDFTVLQQQLANGEKLNDRNNFNGHVTGSAIVLSPDHTQILLIHHRLFDRWLQPGGHWESDEEANPLEAARREAEEETGVKIAEYIPVDPGRPLVPFDISIHLISARPERQELEHYHHDFRYLFVAASDELTHQDEEVHGAGWFAFDAPESQSVARPVAKLRAFDIV